MALFGDNFVVEIARQRLIDFASEAAITEIVTQEVHKQITEDPDMRVLVRELVADSISKMNLREVVAQAVALALQDQKVIEPNHGSVPTESFTCPSCRRTSYHPDDVKHRYCGACHKFC